MIGKRFRKIFLISSAFNAVILIIVTLSIIPGLRTDPAARIALVIFWVTLVGVEALILFLFRPILREQEVLDTGKPARAKLLQFWDTGTTINDDPLVGMQLEVYPYDAPAYPAETKTIVSRLFTGMLRPGAMLQVKIGAEDPQKVAFVAFDSNTSSSEDDTSLPSQPSLASDLTLARLSELDELRQREMISEEDYYRRRSELLGSPKTSRELLNRYSSQKE